MTNKKVGKKDKTKDFKVFLGDAAFNRKLSVYYSWFAPAILAIITIILFTDKAYLVGVLTLALALYLSPLVAKFKMKIPPLFRALLAIALIYLIFQSMYLYIK